jgi:hypothetical protein
LPIIRLCEIVINPWPGLIAKYRTAIAASSVRDVSLSLGGGHSEIRAERAPFVDPMLSAISDVDRSNSHGVQSFSPYTELYRFISGSRLDDPSPFFDCRFRSASGATIGVADNRLITACPRREAHA